MGSQFTDPGDAVVGAVNPQTGSRLRTRPLPFLHIAPPPRRLSPKRSLRYLHVLHLLSLALERRDDLGFDRRLLL